jgi:Uma2 family endonuclease
MTANELFALPCDDRLDRRLIHGRLVERPYPFRTPAHAAVVANLSGLFRNWERQPVGAGWVAYGYGCPYRLRWDPDTLVYFDSSVIPAALDDATPARAAFIDGRPTLAVEVCDANDEWEAIAELADAAMEAGVPLLWLVDPVEEFVAVFRPGCESVAFDRDDMLDASDAGPQIRFPVSALFE